MKTNLKKLMLLALALVMAISLCACGEKDRDDDDDDDEKVRGEGTSTIPALPWPEEEIPNEEPDPTEPPAPAEPTEEEWNVLQEYVDVANRLNNYPDQQALRECYEILNAMDLQVIDTWKDSEFCSAEYWGNDVNWNYSAILEGFSVVENVMLKQQESYTDFVGNHWEDYYYSAWEYDADGMIRSTHNEMFAFKIVEDNISGRTGQRRYTYDENGRLSQIRFGSGLGENFTTEYLMTLIYDENGNKIQEQVMNTSGNSYEIHYEYDEANRLSCIRNDDMTIEYTYDSEGKLISSEQTNYITRYNTAIPHTKTIMEYTYDENGHLVSGLHKNEQWTYELETIKHGWLDYEYIISAEYCEYRQENVYTFTLDTLGNISHVEIIPGNTYGVAEHNMGQLKSEAVYASQEIQITWGNYYIYNSEN